MFDPAEFLDLLASRRTSDDEIVDLDGCVIRVSDFVDAVSLTAEERADAEGCVSVVHYRRHLDDRVAEACSRLSTAEETTASPVEEPTEPPTEEPAEPPAEEPRDQTRNAPPLTIGAITPKVGPPIRVGRGPKVLGST